MRLILSRRRMQGYFVLRVLGGLIWGLVLGWMSSCAEEDGVLVAGDEDSTEGDERYVSLPENCSEVTALFPVENLLSETDHPCSDWVLTSARQLLQVDHGSAFRWGSSSESVHGASLVVTALHVALNEISVPDDEDLPEWLAEEPLTQECLFTAWDDTQGGLSQTALPSAKIYHPFLPAEQSENGFLHLLPKNDQTLFVMAWSDEADSCSTQWSLTLSDISSLVKGRLQARQPVADELVLLLGFPREAPWEGRLSAAVGRVLSEKEAEECHQRLQALDDEEGAIPLDLENEWFLEGLALGGMSGGGVFNQQGQPVGILVRGAEQQVPGWIARASKLNLLGERVQHALESGDDWE